MATQASAVTFLSMPGQGYQDGLGFVQNYFVNPLALDPDRGGVPPDVPPAQRVHGVRVPGLPVRCKDPAAWGAALFLLQCGLQAGITVYAVPAIIPPTAPHCAHRRHDPAHGDRRDRLHGRGRQPGSERDAKVPARRDLLRDARGLRRPARPDAARGRARPRPAPWPAAFTSSTGWTSRSTRAGAATPSGPACWGASSCAVILRH